MRDLLITWWFRTGHREPVEYEHFEPGEKQLVGRFLECLTASNCPCRAGELRDDGDARPERVQADRHDVDAVDEDAAQSDAPRGVDVDAIAARLPAQHHLAASLVVRESRV